MVALILLAVHVSSQSAPPVQTPIAKIRARMEGVNKEKAVSLVLSRDRDGNYILKLVNQSKRILVLFPPLYGMTAWLEYFDKEGYPVTLKQKIESDPPRLPLGAVSSVKPGESSYGVVLTKGVSENYLDFDRAKYMIAYYRLSKSEVETSAYRKDKLDIIDKQIWSNVVELKTP